MTTTRSIARGAALAIVGAGLVAGCANPLAEQALTARTTLVGMPKERLLSCAGVPQRQAEAGGQEFFTYRSDRIVSRPAPGWAGYGGPWWPGYGHPAWWGAGWPGYGDEVRSYACEATFTLEDGVVRRVVYNGTPDGAGGMGQCYYVVQSCLAPAPG